MVKAPRPRSAFNRREAPSRPLVQWHRTMCEDGSVVPWLKPCWKRADAYFAGTCCAQDTVRRLRQGGHFWVAAEPAGNTIKSLDDCVLGFDLGAQATHGHAAQVAEFLNENIVAITLS